MEAKGAWICLYVSARYLWTAYARVKRRERLRMNWTCSCLSTSWSVCPVCRSFICRHVFIHVSSLSCLVLIQSSVRPSCRLFCAVRLLVVRLRRRCLRAQDVFCSWYQAAARCTMPWHRPRISGSGRIGTHLVGEVGSLEGRYAKSITNSFDSAGLLYSIESKCTWS